MSRRTITTRFAGHAVAAKIAEDWLTDEDTLSGDGPSTIDLLTLRGITYGDPFSDFDADEKLVAVRDVLANYGLHRGAALYRCSCDRVLTADDLDSEPHERHLYADRVL